MLTKKAEAVIDRYSIYGECIIFTAMIVAGILLRRTTLGFALTFTGSLFIYMEILCIRNGRRGGKVAATRYVWRAARMPLFLALNGVGIVLIIVAGIMPSPLESIFFHGGFWLAAGSTSVMIARFFWKEFHKERQKERGTITAEPPYSS